MPTFKEKHGYSRVNLLSRKEKDSRNVSAAASRGGGSVTLKSNKTTLPLESKGGSPTTMTRGTTVKVKSGQKQVGTRKVTLKPSYSEKVPGKTSTSETFVAGDMNGGKVNDRATTPELGKSLKENPTKTSMRMKAQAGGQTSYKAPSGKDEYSGRKASVTVQEPETTVQHPAVTKDEPVMAKTTTYDAKMAPKSTGSSGGKISGSRGYSLKFKDNGGSGTPQGAYYKTKTRKKMMKGSGY